MEKIEFIEHTADIRMRAKGDSLEELFRAALSGMNKILSPNGISNNRRTEINQEILINSNDATALAVDFLSEILTLSYENKAIFSEVCFFELNEKKLKAKVMGRKVAAFKEDIKAVTYHEAQVKESNKGYWETNIVFDI